MLQIKLISPLPLDLLPSRARPRPSDAGVAAGRLFIQLSRPAGESCRCCGDTISGAQRQYHSLAGRSVGQHWVQLTID